MGRSLDILVKDLKNSGILKSRKIVTAIKKIDRKDFVPTSLNDDAYLDEAMPIGHGQTISQPTTVVFMLELLQPSQGDSILDIGSGSGWQTSLLAEIVGSHGHVLGVENLKEIYLFGRKNIEKYNFIKRGIVKLKYGDATSLTRGAFDKIICAASASREPPESWVRMLKVGGRMVVPVGNSVLLYKKTGVDTYETEEFPGFVFVPLISGKDENTRFMRKIILVMFSSFVIFGFLTGIIFPPRASGDDKFEIREGANARTIGRNLKSRNIIRSEYAFVISTYLLGVHDELPSGSFRFTRPRSIFGVIRSLAEEREEIVLLVPEGVTIRDISRILEHRGFLAANDFISAASDVPEDFPFESFEGFLFPDTYRLYLSSSARDLVNTFNNNFEKRVDQLMANIDASERSLAEIITMASLIEKEVRTKDDKELVAGVLWKRIDEGYPLQVDATLFYESGKTSFELSLDDLKADTPYNTYVHKGLPPSPISNPGLTSIEAALHPKESPYYFYLSDNTGKTHFARNFEEHKANKFRYLR